MPTETDLDDENGSFDFDRWFVGAGLDYLWSPRTALGISIGGGRSNYGFENITGISDGDPWEEIEDYRVSIVSRFETSSMPTIVPFCRISPTLG